MSTAPSPTPLSRLSSARSCDGGSGARSVAPAQRRQVGARRNRASQLHPLARLVHGIFFGPAASTALRPLLPPSPTLRPPLSFIASPGGPSLALPQIKAALHTMQWRGGMLCALRTAQAAAPAARLPRMMPRLVPQAVQVPAILGQHRLRVPHQEARRLVVCSGHSRQSRHAMGPGNHRLANRAASAHTREHRAIKRPAAGAAACPNPCSGWPAKLSRASSRRLVCGAGISEDQHVGRHAGRAAPRRSGRSRRLPARP